MKNVIANVMDWRLWLRGLVAHFIGGGASAAGAWMGMAVAKYAGVDVPQLNWKSLGVIYLSSGLVSVFSYLKESPLAGYAEDEMPDPQKTSSSQSISPSVTGMILVILLATGSVFAQGQVTTTPTTPEPTIQGGLQMIADAITAGKTNWFVEAHGLYAPKLALKYGGGAGAYWPLSDYVVTGLRIDYVNGGFEMVSGNATLQLPLTPIKQWKWLRVTPFGYAGIGVPWGEAAKENNSEPTAILGYGGAIQLYKSKDGKLSFDLVGDREQWTGFAGNQYRFGLLAHIKF